jgi:hypothetical protein
MSVAKHWLLRWYLRRLIVHQQRYKANDSNTNVYIEFSAHDEFSAHYEFSVHDEFSAHDEFSVHDKFSVHDEFSLKQRLFFMFKFTFV